MNALARHWPILFRAWLYFMIGFLAPFCEAIFELLKRDEWPSQQRWTLGIIAGFSAGLVAVRAFYDGSVQRHSEELRQSDQANVRELGSGELPAK